MLLISLLLSSSLYSFFSIPIMQKTTVVVIDPAGDAQHPGRMIATGTERSITLRLAQEIKARLEFGLPSVKIVITRDVGQTVQPLQAAQLSNRLQADLHIALSCYQESGIRPTITLYHLLWHPTTDYWYHQSLSPQFLPIFNAYLPRLKQTTSLGSSAAQFCAAQAPQNGFLSNGCFGIPIKSVFGCLAPAFNLELGLRTEHEWHAAISLCTDLLAAIIKRLAP
jgi:hypothetical protein